MLYDDYLRLVASNKQQIQWTRIQNLQEHWITGNFLTGADSSNYEVVNNAMKCASRPIVSV